MAEHFDTIVIGGGIAGVSALSQLAQRGSALLLERETSLAAHASGRNAAIYRPLEHDQTTAELARRSLEILASLTSEPVLRRVGILLVAREAALIESTARDATDKRVPFAVFDRPQCAARVTALDGGDVAAGVLLPDAGVLDIARMVRLLAARARDHGGVIRAASDVEAIETVAGRVVGVRLRNQGAISGDRVVLAAGAWGETLAKGCGSAITLTPIRRHLVQLEVAAPINPQDPVVWCIDPDHELYFRPQADGILASPCDASASIAGASAIEPAALERLTSMLSNTAPSLAKARVHDAWACLRTFASDRELLVGPDPTVAGLYWMGGLGGRGMAVAVGAAQLLGTLVASSTDNDLARRVSPARFRTR